MAEPIRLLIVDTPTLVRKCLALVLSRRRGLRVVGEASTGDEARALAQTLDPDVVLLEPAVPKGGLALVASLCQQVPSRAVLLLAQPGGDAAVSLRALQAGARAYLEKDCEPADLVRAIERVRAGELVVAPAAASAVLKGLGGDAHPSPVPARLTAREIEVLVRVAHGRSNPEIAQDLWITEHTVKGHVAKMLRKLRFENRVQLATFAAQYGLGPAPASVDADTAALAPAVQETARPAAQTPR